MLNDVEINLKGTEQGNFDRGNRGRLYSQPVKAIKNRADPKPCKIVTALPLESLETKDVFLKG